MTRNPLLDRFTAHASTWAARTGSDAYSGSTYATPVSIRGRWQDEEQLVTTKDRGDVISRAHFSTPAAIGVGDTLTAPDGSTREVLTVRRATDVRGRPSHSVAFVT